VQRLTGALVRTIAHSGGPTADLTQPLACAYCFAHASMIAVDGTTNAMLRMV
jgi:hypothetical protein